MNKSKKREAVLETVNASRATRGLGATDAGFNYGMAIEDIMSKTSCTLVSIGERIGVTRKQVKKYLDDEEIPNHVSGELLWGLYKDTFPDRDPRQFLLTTAQQNGGNSDRPPRTKRLRG
jgi:hypothetical protein